jgi:hypothetical protein
MYLGLLYMFLFFYYLNCKELSRLFCLFRYSTIICSTITHSNNTFCAAAVPLNALITFFEVHYERCKSLGFCVLPWALLFPIYFACTAYSFKGAQAWEFFARVFCTKWTHLGMWLRDWGKKIKFFISWPLILIVFGFLPHTECAVNKKKFKLGQN